MSREQILDTVAEAHKRIAERVEQYPNGDWPRVTVGKFIPAEQSRIYPRWEPVQ